MFENSKIFLDGVFLFIYLHLIKKLELSKLHRKKLWGSKNPENGLFKKSEPIKKETYFFILFCFYIKAKWLIKKFALYFK